MKTKFHSQKIINKINKHCVKNLYRAAIYLQGEVQTALSGGPSPSPEGTPPAQVSGTLMRSIKYSVDEATLTARVGAKGPSVRRLELGFVGSDTLGRFVNQGPRSFLRSTLQKKKRVIKRILHS